jgi:hypothetical protein
MTIHHVQESRCIETRLTTAVNVESPASPELPEIRPGFLRRAIDLRIRDGGMADVVTLDVEIAPGLGSPVRPA